MRHSIGQGAIPSDRAAVIVESKSRFRPAGWVAAALLLAGTLATTSVVQAQVQRSFINISFEQPVLPSSNCYSIREAADVPGWETTEANWTGTWDDNTHGSCGGHPPSTPVVGGIQMFRNEGGVAAANGNQWAELNAFTGGRRLYQSVCMVAGEQVQWSLFHRGRGGTNSFRFNIGTNPTGSGSTRIFDGRTTTGGSGAILATGLGTSAVQSQASATWARYSGSFTWNSSGLTGSNFIMKLDERTLPIGYRVTSENPRVIRLTAGRTSTLDFGAARVRQVRLDLQDAAFLSGSLELRTEWAQGIDQLITLLAAEESTLFELRRDRHRTRHGRRSASGPQRSCSDALAAGRQPIPAGD